MEAKVEEAQKPVETKEAVTVEPKEVKVEVKEEVK